MKARKILSILVVMIMALYFYTFTRKQILKQKVGKFNYV